MYHQINATETFGERQLLLLQEAENRRLARRLRAARRSGQYKVMRHLRKTALLFAAVVLVLLISATAALAEIKGGTDNPETIVGTNSADHIIGKGGDDTLKGLAANDTYHFDDGFGKDTLIERAFVKVGEQRLPGGSDTLNFSQYSGGQVTVRMIPQWDAQVPNYNNVLSTDNADAVDLRSSPVENVVGSSFGDFLEGGSARNTYNGGPGGSDLITDYGGDDGSAIGGPFLPDLPASDDTYKGFAAGTGHDTLSDFGGTADKLDLRPLESSDVYFDAFDQNVDGTNDSLRIVISDATSVTVDGHFFPLVPSQENGRMEKIIFSNEVVTSAAELNSLMQETSSPSEGSRAAR